MEVPEEAKTYSVLEGKVAIITGAANGMGRATALTFTNAGAKVVVADINEVEGKNTVSMIGKAGGEGLFVKCDISKSADVKNLVEETVAKFGKLDVAINNAALAPDRTNIIDFDENYWNKLISINLTGTALCCKYELQQFKKQGHGGSIVNIASINAYKAQPNMPAYTVSKHAIVGLTKHAAMESGSYGVRVNSIAPGAVYTEMSANALKIIGTTAEEFAPQVSYLNRLAQPHEVAQGSLWLASDASSYVTGICLPIDAGYSSR